jgi:hypothetical protein
MRAETLRKMLAQAPDNGKNNLLITRKPNMIDVLGKDWFDTEEGETSIFKTEGGKYRFVARLQMEARPKLAVVAKQTSNGSLVSLKARRRDFNADV